jgi:arsenite-transporting ATPase
MESLITPTANLENIILNKTLKWIFVGGKGGVGKTTVSSTMSILLSKIKEKVLIISTDPAHNLSDAFNQKMGSKPTLIKGFTNLYGLEIDPKTMNDDDYDSDINSILGLNIDDETKGIFDELKNSIPGIDEALAIGLLLQVIDKMDFSIIVFDTAPSGHTLRMLSLPKILEETLGKLNSIKDNFGMFNNIMQNTMGNGFNQFMQMNEMLKKSIQKINEEFTNKEHTTFVTVCIQEFLSMYETERLIQELDKNKIDCHNIVINQVLFVNKENDNCNCDMCKNSFEMQSKYINQIKELYCDNEFNMNGNQFYISILPLQEEEVRGVDKLIAFTKFISKS